MKWTREDDLLKYGIKMIAEKKKIPLGEKTVEYQIYNIPLEHLKYNLGNGRIFMEINKLQREEEVDLHDLMNSNINEYNNEIENLIWESSIEKNQDTLEDIEKYTQLESGVVLDDGTVIDGNRRFTCLRRLHAKYPEDERYEYFKAAIIFLEGGKISKKDLKKYELKVQFGRDEKVDYKTINFNMSIYENIKSGEFSIQEMADSVHRKPSDITKIMATSELVEDMLKYINHEGQLSIAEDLNIYWPLEPLAAYLNSTDGKKMSEIEKTKKKQMYYDYILTLDIGLPTQSLRDHLINKIFKNDALYNELAEKYDNNSGEIVNSTLINNDSRPHEFVEKVKDFKKSDDAREILADFNKIKEKAGLEKSIEQPIKICSDIKDSLLEINLTPHLNATSERADDTLQKVKSKLEEIIRVTEEIIQNINNKLDKNE